MKHARKFASILGFLALACSLGAQPVPQLPAKPGTWVASWGASQQIPESQNTLPTDDFSDATIRQIFRLSVGGTALRVHLSNAFGTDALHITAAHIAKPLSTSTPAIDPKSDRPLLFAGQPEVTIPPGAEFISDPLDYPLAPLSDLAVSFHVDQPPARQTGHPGSRATSWYVHRDLGSAATFSEPKQLDHWYQVSEIDVLATPDAASIVALGDSITDGHGATTNGNNRWTDILAQRLQAAPETRSIGVSNQGIGGNHLLTDGLGPNVLARFDRDVLAPAAVRWLIVFEGVNDLGGLARDGEVPPGDHKVLVNRVIAAYQQIVLRAHAQGLRVYGATITPYVGSDYYHPSPASEADRQAVNQWIRVPGNFDAVIDFDSVLRNPAHPDQLLPAYDCGDHLHPSPAGYKAMAEAIPLNIFAHSSF